MMKFHLARRTLLAICVGALVAPTPSLASEKKEAAPTVGQYIDISPVPLPVVVDGRIINYIFTSVRVNLAGNANSLKLREKEPYLRDALVRAGHAKPFVLQTSYVKLDELRIRTVMDGAARGILGPSSVAGIVVTSQTAKQTVGLPRPPAQH